MKIMVTRSGGFAGLTEKIADLETDQLPPATAEKISAKLQGAGFYDYAEAAGDAAGADTYRYEITVTEGPRHHSVTFSEGAPKAGPLLELVQVLSSIK